MDLTSLNEALNEKFGGKVAAAFEEDKIRMTGEMASWDDIVEACYMAAALSKKTKNIHVVNDIIFTDHEEERHVMRVPDINDDSLEGNAPDVLVIGGGISGASIARELTKWNLKILLVDKENDLAMQASGRNDGEVHPGVDLDVGSLKQHYVIRGNAMYGKVCEELGVPFERLGQHALFDLKEAQPMVEQLIQKRIAGGVVDTRIATREEIFAKDPYFNPIVQFSMNNPCAGVVCPYGLTIAYAENAVQNGAQVSLNTVVKSFEVVDGKIVKVETNRGNIYPKLVVNAAGVFSDDIAEMAGDRFFSIHPRRGTNSILDKKRGKKLNSIASIHLQDKQKANTKGGGIMRTVDGNVLAGPDAVETWEKENYATTPESIDTVFKKQTITMPSLNKGEIITYFTGVRAPSFEEDFIIERGRKTANIYHCAGIQSPGLTTAPAVALDVSKEIVGIIEELSGVKVEENENFDPIRKPIPRLREMSNEDRNALIKENPDYGVIICRCEEISRGEIIDALKSTISVPTVDGIKKRVRPGMGRCQGGFCMPPIISIIAEYLGVPEEEVMKSGSGTWISLGKTTEGAK